MVDFLRGNPPVFFPSNNWGIGRKRFQQLNGLHTDFPLAAGEDREFCLRAQPLVDCPNAIVYHRHDLTLRRFWQQHVNYGRGAYQLGKVRQSSSLSALAFYCDLLIYPIQQVGVRGISSSALLALAQVATTVGFIGLRIRFHPAEQAPL
jgi:GT2 family glycosyltransferase